MVSVAAVRRPRWAGLTAGLIAIATDVFYLIVIWNQGQPAGSSITPPELEAAIRAEMGHPLAEPRVVFIAAAIAIGGVAAAIAPSVRSPGPAAFVAAAAATGLLALGVIGMWSIGIFLIVAAGFAIASAASVADHTRGARGPSVTFAGGVVAILLIAGGFVLTL